MGDGLWAMDKGQGTAVYCPVFGVGCSVTGAGCLVFGVHCPGSIVHSGRVPLCWQQRDIRGKLLLVNFATARRVINPLPAGYKDVEKAWTEWASAIKNSSGVARRIRPRSRS